MTDPSKGQDRCRVHLTFGVDDTSIAEAVAARLETSRHGFAVSMSGGDRSRAQNVEEADCVLTFARSAYAIGHSRHREHLTYKPWKKRNVAIVLDGMDRFDSWLWRGVELVSATILNDSAEWALFELHLSEASRITLGSPREVHVLSPWSEQTFVASEIAPTLAVHGWEVLLQSSAGGWYNPNVDAVFVVASNDSGETEWLEAELANLTNVNARIVEVRRGRGQQRLMKNRLHLDFSQPSPEARSQLLPFLPLDEAGPRATPADLTRYWEASVFSEQLRRAVQRRQRELATRLVRTAAALLRRRSVRYGADALSTDLGVLRAVRYFDLLVALSDAAVAGGIDTPTIVRQRAQALIETSQLSIAEGTLEALAQRLSSESPEYGEVTGLLGRVAKQRYVNAALVKSDVGRDVRSEWLRSAISAYYRVYERDRDRNLWHGVNALSLLARAERDRVDVLPMRGTDVEPESASAIANAVLQSVALAQNEERLTHWDTASAAEAAVVAGDEQQIESWLSKYVSNENTDAFSLASTHRQFVEVLGLDTSSRAVQVLAKALESAVGGDVLSAVQSNDKTSSFLVRASGPNWRGTGIAGLKVLARMGDVIACEGTDDALRAVTKDSQVISVEHSAPVQTESALECHDTVPFVRATPAQLGTPVERGDQAIVAVIDTGIDVRHRAFCDAAGRTRLLAVWDQTSDTGPAPSGLGFGTEYGSDEIDAILRSSPADGSGFQGRFGSPAGIAHGTHVASIAAGSPTGTSFSGGVAQEAGIVVVVAKLDDLGFQTSHCAALQYIDGVAKKFGRPTVVNVSLGRNGGAHDGRSPFEVAFEMFTGYGTSPGRVVVKSAGNEGDTRGHARVHVRPGHPECLLGWTVADNCTLPQSIELWFGSGDKLRFRLGCGADLSPSWVDGRTRSCSGTFPGGNRYNLFYTPRHRDNGDAQLVVQLGGGTQSSITNGPWRLEIEALEIRPNGGKVEAWIERQAWIPGLGSQRAMEFTNHLVEEMTISIPGTAPNVIAVGACGRTNGAPRPQFSSSGPTRDGRNKPELCAPGMGVTAAGSGTLEGVRAMDGTSQAAPHVAGAVALLMSRLHKGEGPQVNAAQLLQALAQTSQGSEFGWHPVTGHGVLDVEALLRAF